MKSLYNQKLIYSGYTQDLSNAADRRRFPYFLSTENKDFEFSWKAKDCDIAYITDASDLSGWCDYKDKRGDDFILILEFVDMHFHYPPSIAQYAKGSLRFFTGRESKYNFRYTDSLKRACRTADVIVCASDDQHDILKLYNDNVHITLDRFETPTTPPKSNFTASNPFKIGWEGQPYTLNGVNVISEALNAFGDKIELHVITDKVMKGFGSKVTKSVLSQIPDVKCPVTIDEWHIDSFQRDVCACDAMILPLDHNNFSQWAKPANRMLSLWHLNMPVISSSSRAFKDLQEAAGLDYYCASSEDWQGKISQLMSLSANERGSVAAKGRDHAQAFYNDEALMAHWKTALKSVNITI